MNYFYYCPNCSYGFQEDQSEQFKHCPNCGARICSNGPPDNDYIGKLAAFQQKLLQELERNPVKALGSGLAASAAGAGLTLLSAPVIAIGGCVAGVGSGVIAFGIAVSGLGLLIGVMGESSETIKKALFAGTAISAVGGIGFISGLLIQGIGYFMIPAGALLALTGAGLVGYSCKKLLEGSEAECINESLVAVANELRKNGGGSDDSPVIILDMNKQNGE